MKPAPLGGDAASAVSRGPLKAKEWSEASSCLSLVLIRFQMFAKRVYVCLCVRLCVFVCVYSVCASLCIVCAVYMTPKERHDA